ncbi:hypothetical protein QBC36DRAFT_193979 [Triangularia setosa]|uniref:C2H2-type domain-containing protein n=1 Tax=Triangularia setosa TaxID=2587417 RepID=A0AAN6W3Q6_9PEZI|nr:hypothetical protein QBC36DRAFT_193979 [Podospora setosa]
MTGQTSQAFAEFAENGSIGGWLFGRRDGSASTTTPAKAHPTPPTALDSEPPQITSDILLSRAAIHSPAIQFAPPPPKDAGPKSTKYTNEADWRKAISEALKRRRASGANGQSHGRNKKRVQMGNVQSSLLSFPPPSGLSGQHQSRPLEPASTSSTSASASTSESSDVEMDHLTPILAPENIPDDSNDGDWEEGSQGSNVSVANLLNSQLQTEATEAADTVPHRALELTPSGRLYLRWNNEPMYGTLIPDGYEWSTARPGFPWICPVRSCRKLFPAVKQLGGHFVRQHRGSLLNDNMDGTLSIRGRYADLRNGEGVPLNNRPKPGIVVSVGPLDPSEPPMVAPSLPEQGRHDVDHNHSQLGAGSENSAAQSPALTSATGGPSSSTPSPGDGFEFAEPGRKYTEWSDENGDPRSLCGALIPAGYTMRSEPRQKPFCCPVRNCAMECMRVKDLGFHFARGHYASYLKDNGDGTFDVVGVYAPKRGNIVGSGKILNPSPPIVVAQTRPNGSIDWVPNWGSMKLLPTQDVAAAAAAAAVHDSASDVPMGEEAPKTWDWPPKSTWEQMEPTPILSQAAQNFWLKKVLPALPGASNIPRQPSVIKLLECRQKRELHPGPNAGENQFAGAKVREIAATVIQMVGDELQTGVCTKCQDERGMWREVVWKDKHQKHISPRPQAMMANEERDAIMEDVDQREEGPSTRYQMRTRATVSEQEQQQQQEPVIERRQPPNSLITKDGASNGVMATGLVPSESVFEMEDWEMAPGRIRDPSSECEFSAIAFSKSYLSSSQAVDVCEDIAFRVDTIQSGHNFKIEADSNQMRLCSLASGKLRVKIEDEPEFVIGPHGMFKVKAGVACTVTNRMYIDAIMHTTVLNGFVLG